ncbi:MAG: DUF5815 family protein [Halobacteriaceae archaeon]
MKQPRVPDSPESGDEREANESPVTTALELPCGEQVDAINDVDLGMREINCKCGNDHAVVLDVHPPSRFLPESIVATLQEVIEARDADEVGEFGTAHLMGMVLEEMPEKMVSTDVSGSNSAGYALVWITDHNARELHELVVELVVEMMDHAIGHSSDPATREEFEEYLEQFDVEEFVRAYRSERDFEDETDTPI